ncbi:hypothetical protein [Enterobacter hormaechei]|uniref:hypothetical protein n=1 Tax=Enterobacter hormaechei TaxID=158836 RepID=UPI00352333C3
MSNKYEDLIKNAGVNAECGEHMSPEEVTALLNVVETTFSALAAENAGLKSKGRELLGEACAVYAKFNKLIDPAIGDFIDGQTLHEFQYVLDCETQATDAFLDEVRASAVDEVCLKISNAIVNCYQDEQIGLDAAATICGDFAAQLRKGVQS